MGPNERRLENQPRSQLRLCTRRRLGARGTLPPRSRWQQRAGRCAGAAGAPWHPGTPPERRAPQGSAPWAPRLSLKWGTGWPRQGGGASRGVRAGTTPPRTPPPRGAPPNSGRSPVSTPVSSSLSPALILPACPLGPSLTEGGGAASDGEVGSCPPRRRQEAQVSLTGHVHMTLAHPHVRPSLRHIPARVQGERREGEPPPGGL